MPPPPHSLPTRRSSDLRIDPLDTGAADSSIPHPTSPDGQYEEVPFKSAPSLLPWWVTDGASGFPPTGPGNRTIPSAAAPRDRKSTRLNSSHVAISYAVC